MPVAEGNVHRNGGFPMQVEGDVHSVSMLSAQDASQASRLGAEATIRAQPVSANSTGAGSIPTGWEVRSFREVVEIPSGQVDPRLEPYRSQTLLAPDHIESGSGRLIEAKTAAEQGAISGKYEFRPGDVVYSKIRPHLRKATLVDFSGICSADMYPFRPRPGIAPGLILATVLSSRFSEFAEATSLRSGMPKINREELAGFSFILPSSLIEQQAIAAALSDADALIAALEALIAKKRDVKQGAMQELLTGQRHTHRVRLGSVLRVGHGRTQKAVEASDGPYPILASGGQIGTASQFLYDRPSVLIGRKGTIDRPQFVDRPFWTIDTLFYTVISEPNSPKYLFYKFCMIDWRQYNEASGVPSLNSRTIEGIEVDIHDPNEQRAIAAILSDMDAEIAALEAKLVKARHVKQGMMQALLTGEVRLISSPLIALQSPSKSGVNLMAFKYEVHGSGDAEYMPWIVVCLVAETGAQVRVHANYATKEAAEKAAEKLNAETRARNAEQARPSAGRSTG